jgi:hypothetical protein
MTNTMHPQRQVGGELLSAVRAAEYLGFSRGYFHERIKHELPYVQVTDSVVRYRRVDLDEWAAERTVRPTT